MANILKCKMCGGDIEVSQYMTVGKCLFCGSTMTLPRIDSEKKARLFNRANEYRLNNEFDKAYDAYKTITEEDEQEAEAYWGMILSEYGVEYVEDPVSGKRIPTCHRTQVTDIQNTTNYKMALQYADSECKFMYQDEAAELDNLQRDILSVSSKEEPYDVFICYKESEEDGERTQDSVLAQEIYGELNRNGIRTFFARISLEDHLGENYEPYIYAALSSAKVMIVVSTKRDHSEAIWVKNEWVRFLGFMKEDPSKTIIPVYKEISPYDFPPELSKYQAQNMEKVGAVQDLVHGVSRIIGHQEESGSRVAAVERFVFEQKDKEEKAKQRNKKIIRIAALICAIVAVILSVFGLKSITTVTKRKHYTNELKNKTIALVDDIPSADEYLGLIVELDEVIFSRHFTFQKGGVSSNGKNTYFLINDLYEKGWVYLKTTDGNFVEEKSVIKVSELDGSKQDFLPYVYYVTLNPPEVRFRYGVNSNSKPKLFFVSKRMVDDYEIYDDGITVFRHLKLLDGSEIENVIGEKNILPNSVLTYYY